MRKHLFLCIAIIATLGLAGGAGAAPVNYTGTITVITGSFGTGSIYPTYGVATVNASAGVIPAHLNTLRLAGSRQGPKGTVVNIVTDPEGVGNGIAAIIYQEMEVGTGTLAPISAGAQSATPALTQRLMPLHGMVKVCLITTACTTFIPLNLTTHTTGSATIGVGIGGLLVLGGVGGIRMSLLNDPWTIKTATVITQIETVGGNFIFTTRTFTGFAHDPGSGTTATAQPSGVVQLVAPTQVWTNLPFGPNVMVASGNIIRLHFMPEPGVLALLGTSVVGLALLGRRRMRR